MNTEKLSNFGARLATTTALVSLAFAYGARTTARAGVCVPGGGGTYSCFGPAGADLTQSFSAPGISVTTTPGFGLNAAGDAFFLISSGAGGVSFDDSGNPAGSDITAGYGRGISIQNYGGGAVSVTTNGAVSSNNNYSYNSHQAISVSHNSGGGNVTITTNDTVNANSASAIYTNTIGSSGDTVITANAAVSSGTAYGGGGYNTIYAFAYNSASDISISAGDVTNNRDASGRAISALNNANGSHNMDITVSGTVSGSASGGYGIFAGQSNSTGLINVTLDAGANVSGGGDAILIDGGGGSINTLTINSGGGITGSTRMYGASSNVVINGGDMSNVTTIRANSGSDVVTIGAGATTVTGGQFVDFENFNITSGGAANVGGTLEINSVFVDSGGTLSAGASPGQLNIVGDLHLGTGSTTLVELAGLLAGTGYDQIDVTDDPSTGTFDGNANISNGAIFDIDFFGGFAANLGDSFDILVADSLNSGTVDNFIFDFSGAVLGAGLGWHYEIIDGARDTLQLSVVEGDAIPEPSTFVLFGAGVLGIAGMARRRRRKAA